MGHSHASDNVSFVGFLVCTQSERSIFTSDVFDLLSYEFEDLNSKGSTNQRSSEHKIELANWKFDQMDVNR